VRDEIVAYITHWSARAELPVRQLLRWLKLLPGRFYEWRKRYQQVNQHNALQPKQHWLLAWEKAAIIDYAQKHPDDGYRRLTYMMLDADVVAVSPSSVYRVLKTANLLLAKESKPSKKGTGFEQPTRPHEHWHIDISHINMAGTFYYLCSVLDGYSRYIIHWGLRPQMKESDIEIILQGAHERFPETKPRIISDNGPQFIANDFKEFIRQKEMTHVKTSPYYPQSNGKLERLNRTLKAEYIRPAGGLSEPEQAQRRMEANVQHYNEVRLHSAIGYVTPKDKLLGYEKKIFAERSEKLKTAKQQRLQQFRGEE
jgi:putative transposase